MAIGAFARSLLTHEARALLARLALIKPFALQEPMLPTAALLPDASVAIDRFLVKGRRELRRLVRGYLDWLKAPDSQNASDEEAQRRFAILRLKFNVALVQFDTFADVVTQRSENETGVWLSGLDVVAADALALPGYYEAPPVICYLDRDIGAAIRRARTRMPGGGENPVAIIRVPRERMIGTGIASSLVHEVGHQAAALLDLVDSLRPALRRMQRDAAPAQFGLADLGALDFRDRRRLLVGGAGRHRGHARADRGGQPAARVRVPHEHERSAPDALDPREAQRGDRRGALSASAMAAAERRLGTVLPASRHDAADARGAGRAAGQHAGVRRAAHQSPAEIAARPLAGGGAGDGAAPAGPAVGAVPDWHGNPSDMYRTSPSLVFAVIGQARSDGQISPEDESTLLCKLLTFWALRATVNMSEICAASSTAPSRAA